jgi:hypothetical protein
MPSGSAAIGSLQRIFFNAKKDDPKAIARWRNARRVGPSRAKNAVAAPIPAPAAPNPTVA